MTNQEIKDRAPDVADMEIGDLVKVILESKINIDGKVYQATIVDVKREPTGDADIKIKLCRVFNIKPL